jgi:hypothetical protein
MPAIGAGRRVLLFCAGLAVVLTGVQVHLIDPGGGMTAPMVSAFISIALSGALMALSVTASKVKPEISMGPENFEIRQDACGALAAQEVTLPCNSHLDQQFAGIHGELSQADRLVGDAVGDLVASFRHISALTRSQQEVSLAIVGMAAPAEGGPMGPLLERQTLIAGQIEQELDAAVISLQFGDLVAQLLAHTKVRVDAIGTALQRIDTLDAGQDGGVLSRKSRWMHDRVSRAVLAANAAGRGKPVVQHGMQTGEVELF